MDVESILSGFASRDPVDLARLGESAGTYRLVLSPAIKVGITSGTRDRPPILCSGGILD